MSALFPYVVGAVGVGLPLAALVTSQTIKPKPDRKRPK